MPAYLFIHPFFGLAAVALILTAFALKIRKRKFQRPHYVTALAGIVMFYVAMVVAFWALNQSTSEGIDLFEEIVTLFPHGIAVLLLVPALLGQLGLGATMYFFPKTYPRIVRVHRGNAYLIVTLTVLALLLGVANFIQLLI